MVSGEGNSHCIMALGIKEMEDHIGMTPLSDVGPEREMMGIRYSGIPHYGESVGRENRL